MIKFQPKLKATPSIDLTPLIDVVFLMLIFFMLSTTFIHENRLNIELPKTSTQEGNDKNKPLVLSLNKENQLFWQEEKISLKELELRLQASDELKERALMIQADEKTEHGQVIKVFDILRRNKIVRLSIATELASPELGKAAPSP
jgi:biopolymer transport protein ExbD